MFVRLLVVTTLLGLFTGCGASSSVPPAPQPPANLAPKPQPQVSTQPAMPGEKKRIVFICDASGTMINRLSLLHEELLQNVAALPEDHSYNILFFGDRGDFRALDRWKMVAPGAESRIATKQFLERITPWGTTNPITAIEHAIKFRPDVIYFFSDGEFNSQAEYASVIEAFAAAHRDHATIVNTYLFESLDSNAETTMKKIAKDNKGTFKSISPAGFRSP